MRKYIPNTHILEFIEKRKALISDPIQKYSEQAGKSEELIDLLMKLFDGDVQKKGLEVKLFSHNDKMCMYLCKKNILRETSDIVQVRSSKNGGKSEGDNKEMESLSAGSTYHSRIIKSIIDKKELEEIEKEYTQHSKAA